ncbi:ubiquitin thioesterase OTU1-like, partial [Actinia tenebrosa]|uniref:Ubiquitin thioesterase OTU n=1 Tax=Actinia tenebrosa TaxID=6105 RepID=A0A6P8I8K7_ACTTE
DPVTYNDVFLGQSNDGYCRWIQNADNWGGAIELSILSKHYGIEIAVVDTESERIDRFGENEKYSNRVFLIYDGIHYDPLGIQEDSSDLPLQTVFPITDEKRLVEALSLAADAKKKRHFTNVSKFTLRCLACNTRLSGQAQAQQHAIATGHTNFGEV